MISLQNEYIQIEIALKGAELQRLKSKTTSIEYLWNGDAHYWGKFSPVLFPIVGGLKNNTYYFEGKEFHLPRHGFARDQQFDVQQISDTEALFTLTDNADTRVVYPFSFKLVLHYKLYDTELFCTYKVTNPSDNELLFSIGGHPAFATPTGNNLNYSDYYLTFNKDIELVYHKINQDLIDDETATIILKDGILPLKHQLFYDDALVFKNLKSNCISLKNSKNLHGLDFHFSDFPFFGIWAARDANFVCLEPWCGVADGINHHQQLRNKEGIISLSPRQDWQRTWSIVCF